MQLVILAGGKGTRLRSRLGDLPKPLAPVGGRPILEHQIGLARRHGFDDVLLLLGHGRDAVETWAGDGSRFSVRLRTIDDSPSRGTAGALLGALPWLDRRFLVMYGDTMLNVDLQRFWDCHASQCSSISMLIHPNDHPFDSDLVVTDSRDRVVGLHAPPHEPGRDYRNQVNAGLYVIDREPMTGWRPRDGVWDIARDLLPELVSRGVNIFGYRSSEYIKDAGTPERLDAVNADWESGRIGRGSLSRAARAIFLDRDGTINRLVDYVRTPDEMQLLEGAGAAIRAWNSAGWRVVVVSNQPVIARGDCTKEGLLAIHNRMETLLAREGAFLDRIYYCPHHPDGGYPGECPELKFQCDCRKPATAMIEMARRDLNIDLERSWMIGDSTTDIRTARNAGLRSILVQTGYGGRDGLYRDAPDAVSEDLRDAMQVTFNESRKAAH